MTGIYASIREGLAAASGAEWVSISLFMGGSIAGVVWLVVARRRARKRARRVKEDILKYLLQREQEGSLPSLEAVTGSVLARSGVRVGQFERGFGELLGEGMIVEDEHRFGLTPQGRGLAVKVLRAHRLWEAWLAEFSGFDETKWHKLADSAEHELDEARLAEMEAELNHPIYDPHGDLIPGEDGRMPAVDNGEVLGLGLVGRELEVLHVEDEPEGVYRQALELGLRPGGKIELVGREGDGWKAIIGAESVVIPFLVGAQLNVRVVGAGSGAVGGHEIPMSSLAVGQFARVSRLDGGCMGAQRRRLMDLGFVPGSQIQVEFASPGGNPVAYRVRGAIIALRKDQARHIRVVPGDSAGEGAVGKN